MSKVSKRIFRHALRLRQTCFLQTDTACFSRNLSSASTQQCGPLAGVKVLDMTRILAGPYCTMILADMGATVYKIERPDTGDDTRSWGPPFVSSAEDAESNTNNNQNSLYFMSVNRNKYSVAVNIKHQRGQQIIHDMSRYCDSLVENFLPGTLDALNIGYEALHKTSPHLIYCAITGYGSDGPYRNKPGYDVIAEGEGGMLHITGSENGEPSKIGTAMTDLATGLYAHGAILAALYQRDRHPPPDGSRGRGQRIDCNLLSTQVAQLVNVGVNYLNTGIEPRRLGTSHASIVPYQAFRTADEQYLIIGAGNDEQFQLLCRKLKFNESLLSDERFRTNRLRVKHREVLVGILQDTFSSNTLNYWLDALGDIAMPYGPVNNFARVFAHPQVVHNQMVLQLNHTQYGNVRVMGSPVKFMQQQHQATTVDAQAQHHHRAPPTLGEHTREVLERELQYSQQQIDELFCDGVVA